MCTLNKQLSTHALNISRTHTHLSLYIDVFKLKFQESNDRGKQFISQCKNPKLRNANKLSVCTSLGTLTRTSPAYILV